MPHGAAVRNIGQETNSNRGGTQRNRTGTTNDADGDATDRRSLASRSPTNRTRFTQWGTERKPTIDQPSRRPTSNCESNHLSRPRRRPRASKRSRYDRGKDAPRSTDERLIESTQRLQPTAKHSHVTTTTGAAKQPKATKHHQFTETSDTIKRFRVNSTRANVKIQHAAPNRASDRYCDTLLSTDSQTATGNELHSSASISRFPRLFGDKDSARCTRGEGAQVTANVIRRDNASQQSQE